MPQRKSLEELFHLVHTLKRNMHEQVASLNVNIAPMHIRVMKIIDRKKPCTAIDIANFLGRDKAQVTRLVNTLIKEGLIVKQANPNDKRSQFLCVTHSGELLVKEIAKIDNNIMQKMTSDLPENDLAEFLRIAKMMANNLVKC